MVLFMINREVSPRQTSALPNLTALEYLRAQGLVGVKEGCASGDCGACAIATAKDNGKGGLQYESVNACICPVSALHARHVITAEGLVDDKGRLHPVQQAMVDCHGSQCGFCTPGFVMSLFVHNKNKGGAGREALSDRLAGNLCRCTGYRPILDAGQQAAKNRSRDWFDRHSTQTASALRKLQQTSSDEAPHYYAPRTVSALSTVLAKNPRARIVAGGTDLMLESTWQLRELESLVYIGNVAAMTTIRETRREWIVGAAATYADVMHTIASHPKMEHLHQLLRRFGSPQIRARATVGGNIANASPVADGPPALLVLGAILHLRRGQSTRQLPLEKFYRSYKQTALRRSEFIESIVIPKPQAGEVFRMYKVSKRMDDDIAAVCAAFKFKDDNGIVREPRVAFGGMAAVPARAPHCEQKWAGSVHGAHAASDILPAIAALSKDFSPITDVRAGAAYRTVVAANLLRKAHCDMPSEFLAELAESEAG